jgi:phage terminase large subunit-like protein
LHVRFKQVRASPWQGGPGRMAALYEEGKVHDAGHFPTFEDQLTAFTTKGYMGDGSPDRADAVIWG